MGWRSRGVISWGGNGRTERRLLLFDAWTRERRASAARSRPPSPPPPLFSLVASSPRPRVVSSLLSLSAAARGCHSAGTRAARRSLGWTPIADAGGEKERRQGQERRPTVGARRRPGEGRERVVAERSRTVGQTGGGKGKGGRRGRGGGAERREWQGGEVLIRRRGRGEKRAGGECRSRERAKSRRWWGETGGSVGRVESSVERGAAKGDEVHEREQNGGASGTVGRRSVKGSGKTEKGNGGIRPVTSTDLFASERSPSRRKGRR